MKRIQRKRTKGWKMPPNTIYVGRPTVWGNPFTAKEWKKDGEKVSPTALVLMYQILLSEVFGVFKKKYKQTDEEKLLLHEFLKPLRGKNLACWCALDKPCHADVILELLNRKSK